MDDIDAKRAFPIHVFQSLQVEGHFILVVIDVVFIEEVYHPSEDIDSKNRIEVNNTAEKLQIFLLSDRLEAYYKATMDTKTIEKIVEDENLHFEVLGYLVVLTESNLLIVELGDGFEDVTEWPKVYSFLEGLMILAYFQCDHHTRVSNLIEDRWFA